MSRTVLPSPPLSPPSAPSSAPARSAQGDRLADEWRGLQRAYAYHPYVRVVPIEGEPPVAYGVEYRVRTVVRGEAGAVREVRSVAVEVRVPRGFPDERPVVVPRGEVFHPNVGKGSLAVVPPWSGARDSLVDLVARVGAMVAYQTYDAGEVLDDEAMAWATAHARELPTDDRATFGDRVGGGPLARMRRHGPATLAAMKGQVGAVLKRWLAGPPDEQPSDEDVVTFARRGRAAVGLFLADDVPEELGGPAAVVAECLEALPAARAAFAVARAMRGRAAQATATAEALGAALRAADAEATRVASMVCDEPLPDPMAAARQLPPAAELHAARAAVQALRDDVERRRETCERCLGRLDSRGWIGDVPAAMRRTFADEITAARDEIEAAYTTLRHALGDAAPILTILRQEVVGLDRVIPWREYAAGADGAKALAKQLGKLGATGIQAYHVVADGGRGHSSGPYEFEQAVSVGGAELAVRRYDDGRIEAFDVTRGGSLGAGPADRDLTLTLPGGSRGAAVVVVRATPTCERLIADVRQVMERTKSLIERANVPGEAFQPASSTWCGRFAARLNSARAVRVARERQADDEARWTWVIAELEALVPFKERLATYHLAARVCRTVPRYLEARRAAGGEAEAKRWDAVVGAELAEIRRRITRRRELGVAVAPRFTQLPPLPGGLVRRTAEMGDDQLIVMLRELERKVGRRIVPAGARVSGASGASGAGV